MPLVSFADFGVDDKELYITYLKAHTPVYTKLCEQSEASYIAYLRGFGSNGCCDGVDGENSFDRTICGGCAAGGGRFGARGVGCFAGCRGRFANAVERLLASGDVSTGDDGVGCGRERSVGPRVSVGKGVTQLEDVEICSEVSMVEENGNVNQRDQFVSGAGGNASGVLDEVVRVRGQRSSDSEPMSGRGKNFMRNKRKRDRAKVSGGRSVDVSCGDREKSDLQKSLEEKWKIENELKILKAKKEVELLKSEDLSEVKKLRDRKLRSANEKTMVQIEKAHASLSSTDNVGGQKPGFCYTVVDGEIVEDVPALSGGECSISPSSSVSEREVRAMAKELADVKLELEKKNKRIKRLEDAAAVGTAGGEIAVTVKDGDVAPSAASAFDLVCGKGLWEATGDLDMDPDTLYVKCVDNVFW